MIFFMKLQLPDHVCIILYIRLEIFSISVHYYLIIIDYNFLANVRMICYNKLYHMIIWENCNILKGKEK